MKRRPLASVAKLLGDLRAATSAPADVVERSLDRLSEVDDHEKLNAFISRTPERARSRARDLAAIDAARESAPLFSVPFAAKDNINVAGVETTCGSRILDGFVSPWSATAIERLEEAGAILVGKTNLDEFAMGSSTENSAFGPTLNPLDNSLVPGGSSGGSAVAVAAGIVPFALGSETGGSVRQPAAFCGIVGVKPTYGRVSRRGLVAFGSSLDQIGVFGTCVDDTARVMEVISGIDPGDATSAGVDVEPFSAATAAASLAGIVVGRPAEYFPDDLDPRIRSLCDEALERLKSLGAIVKEVSLPHTSLAVPAYYVVAPAEASSNLARFDGVRYGMRADAPGLREMYERTRSTGFGPEVTRRILLGTYVLSAGYYDAYYRKAMQARALIADDFRRVFTSGVDALFTPTAPTVAFALGTRSDPYEMYLSDVFTCTANLAGVPAMSLPIGSAGGLPVGGQIMCAHFGEERMFRVAAALESSLGSGAS